MITLGSYLSLRVIDVCEHILHLDAEDLGVATLLKKELESPLAVGDTITVLLYENSKSDLMATTKKVSVVGEIAFLPVKSIIEIGAFLDWGLDKDLLVPLAEQHRPFEYEKSTNSSNRIKKTGLNIDYHKLKQVLRGIRTILEQYMSN